MHHYCIFVLAAVILGGLAKPLSPRWDDMHIKHSWNAVPKDWESLGRPPSGTTIDLYIALKPHRENALTDVLYEVSEPGNSRHVHRDSSAHACSHECHCSDADTAHTCPRNRSPSSSLRIQRRSSLLIPGSNTTAYPPRPSP